MKENFFKQINITLQESFPELDELLKLYEAKKEVLIKGDALALTEIDGNILDVIDHLKDLNIQREYLTTRYGKPSMTLTELIEEAEIKEEPLAETFKSYKVKLDEVMRKMTLLEKTNVELLKHNLIMSDKLLNIIISAATPQTENYDKHGKNIDNASISISSIVENA